MSAAGLDAGGTGVTTTPFVDPSRTPRRFPSLAAAGVIAGASILFFVVVVCAGVLVRAYANDFGSRALAGAVFTTVCLVTAAGLVAALVTAIVAVRSGRPSRVTSLRTRSFFVIAVCILVPSFCLSVFGAWAYYQSWNRAEVLYKEQAVYRGYILNREIAGLGVSPAKFSPRVRARLAEAIVTQWGMIGHREGANETTLADLKRNNSLPRWIMRSLRRRGYAIGGATNPVANPRYADIVAWVGPGGRVYVYAAGWGAARSFALPLPFGRLVWLGVIGVALIAALGLIGAWILSRSVVRPVRRLAEGSHRIADAGGAAEPVRPTGPRELRELADSFNDMNAKLAKAQETEQAFLLSVSHELKTPLTSIRGYAEGIGDGTVTPGDGAAVIGSESSRLERLVGDLLDSARMRKSAFTVRREAVDLVEVAQELGRRYEGTACDAGLSLHLKAAPGSSAVADGDRVLQVASNLVENAIRCTPAPGSVTVTTAPGVIAVADTGRGLTGDDLPRAFERFYLYSRYGNDRPVGTGLGLAIVKELTEAMGGSVSVASAVGVGTAFTVTLPAELPAAAAQPHVAVPSAPPVSAPGPLVPAPSAADVAATPAHADASTSVPAATPAVVADDAAG